MFYIIGTAAGKASIVNTRSWDHMPFLKTFPILPGELEQILFID